MEINPPQLQNSSQEPKRDASTETLFYNVMPKDRATGPLVNVGKESLEPDTPTTATNNLKRRIITYIVIVGVAVVICIGIYFIYAYKLKKEGEKNTAPIEHTSTPRTASTTPDNVVPEKPIATTNPEWLKRYFDNEICGDINRCGDDADLDRDGLRNLDEFKANTDPSNNDSDRDGLADGDEVQIFLSNPLKPRSTNDPQFNDADYIKGGFDPVVAGGKKWTPERLSVVKTKVTELGLHEPTLTTLGEKGRVFYGIEHPLQESLPDTGTTSPTSLEVAPELKLERDTQRQNTIKKIGATLVKYKQDQGSFPDAVTFDEVINLIRPYNAIATNPVDPINQPPFTYKYEGEDSGRDFTLSYFSETQNQVIKFKAVDAERYADQESASLLDLQRVQDLQSIQSALLIWSAANLQSGQDYIFPPAAKVKTELVPRYLSSIPKDPKTKADYEIQISEKRDLFIIKAKLENGQPGSSLYVCDQDECRYE